MSIGDYEKQLGHLADMPAGSLEAARLVRELRRVVEVHRLHEATIDGVPMAAFKQEPPATKRESMAAALMAAMNQQTWQHSLNELRLRPSCDYWRLADAALKHIPYLNKLPDGDGT